jgi:hypothetical protein
MDLERIFRLSSPLRRAPTWARYLAATIIVLTFFATRCVIAGAMGGYPFLLFFPRSSWSRRSSTAGRASMRFC